MAHGQHVGIPRKPRLAWKSRADLAGHDCMDFSNVRRLQQAEASGRRLKRKPNWSPETQHKAEIQLSTNYGRPFWILPSAAYLWVEQRTVFFRWIKKGEEVKHINITSHSTKNIETFIFEGTLGPFLECGGFNPRHS